MLPGHRLALVVDGLLLEELSGAVPGQVRPLLPVRVEELHRRDRAIVATEPAILGRERLLVAGQTDHLPVVEELDLRADLFAGLEQRGLLEVAAGPELADDALGLPVDHGERAEEGAGLVEHLCRPIHQLALPPHLELLVVVVHVPAWALPLTLAPDGVRDGAVVLGADLVAVLDRLSVEVAATRPRRDLRPGAADEGALLGARSSGCHETEKKDPAPDYFPHHDPPLLPRGVSSSGRGRWPPRAAAPSSRRRWAARGGSPRPIRSAERRRSPRRRRGARRSGAGSDWSPSE